MANNTTSMSEVKALLNHTIDTNIKLQEEKGWFPTAIGLEADAGIGKTSIVEQVAKDRGMGFTTLVLSQLEEAGDLIGFPIKEYECQVKRRIKNADGTFSVVLHPKTVWLNEKMLDSNPDPNIKYIQTGNTRMSYAKPAWVPEYNENGNILLLDYYSRANQTLLQSMMEIIRTQGYISWKLPKKTTIVLTTNPDNGNYIVSSQDEAMTGRYMTYTVTWDLDTWMKWAEKAGVDSRCINFVASYSNELFNADENGNHICNPRSFTMFANMISTINDWDNADSLAFISMISKGCFRDEGGRFSKMFSAFIRNKMHKLISPKEMLLNKWDTIKDKLDSTVYDSDGKYRPDIASLLERRFTNYVNAWLDSDEDTPIKVVKERLMDFLSVTDKGGRKIFTKDLFYHMIKGITAEHKGQTNKLLFEPKIANAIN